MQLLLLAAIVLLMGGDDNKNISGLLNALSPPPDLSDGDLDGEIDEVLSHIAGERFTEVMKTVRLLEGVTKTFSQSAPKIFEAEEAAEKNGGFYPLAPVQNIADGDILHALSAALTT